MSKLGKKPIQIPKDTKVKIDTGKLIFTGPKVLENLVSMIKFSQQQYQKIII